MSGSQYVIVQLDDQEFAINIGNVGSINDYQKITLAPNSPNYVEGVINLRGDIIPIINLAERLNIKSKTPYKNRRIIVSNVQDKQIGFLVDEASQAITISKNEIKPTPTILKGNDGDYIDGICKYKDDIYLLINLEKILNGEQIRAIKAMELN